MATVASLNVVIGAKTDKLQKEISNVQKILKNKLGAKALGVSKDALKILGGVGAAITGIGIAAVHSAAQMEQTRKAFKTLLKDANLAKEYLAELERFAANTPFSLPGVIDASKRLLAFGFTAEQTIPILTAVGDSASALGMGEEGIQRLTLALGQMQAKGKVSAEEMLQLAEAGVPAWEMLADELGVSIPEAMKMGERGMITSAQGIQSIVSGMNKKFGGMMKEQSNTINGILSNIQDSVGQTMVVIGDQIAEGLDLKDKLKVIQDQIGEFADKIKSMGLGEALRQTIPAEVGMALSAITGLILASTIPALINLGLTAAKVAVAFVTATGPIGVAIAAIGAGAYWLWQHWDWAKAQMEYICDTISANFGIMVNTVKSSFADMVSSAAAKLNVLFGLVGISSDIADDAKKWADETQESAKKAIESAERSKAEAKERAGWVQYDNNGTPGLGTSSSFTASDPNALNLKGSELLPTANVNAVSKKISTLAQDIARAKRETEGFGKEFADLKGDIEYAGLHGTEKVLKGIEREKNERINSLTEVLKRQAAAVEEAEALRNRAEAEGNAQALEQAQELYQQKKAILEQNAAEYMALVNEIENQADEAAANRLTNIQDFWMNFGKSVAGDFSQAVVGIVDGTKTAGAAIAEFARNIIMNAVKMAAEFAGLCGILAMFGVIPPGPVAAKMMFGYDSDHTYKKGSRGAKLMGKANGGYISGPGSSTSDSIPAMLSNGEYVVNAKAVKNIGLPALNAINAGHDVKSVNVGGGSNHSTSVTLSISAMDASSFEDFLSRGGLDRIKQALLDDGRGFRTEAGTW